MPQQGMICDVPEAKNGWHFRCLEQLYPQMATQATSITVV